MAAGGNNINVELPGHAIGINLFNPEDQPALFVDGDIHGHQLTCEITNLAERQLEIPTGINPVSPSNYHFAIRFRRGILAPNEDNTFDIISASDNNWAVSGAIPENDGISIYFLNIGKAITLSTNRNIHLKLKGLRASNRGGTRTTRAEVTYRQIRYTNSAAGVFLSDSRLHFLNIVNHLGHRNSPLRIQWIGNHQVLNDGTEQIFELQVINSHRKTGEHLTFDANSKLVFSFNEDVNDAGDRIVENNADINFYSTKPSIDDNSKGFGNVNNTERILELDGELKSRAFFSVWVKISTTLSAGIAHLHITQQDVPGFWNHTFVLPIEKTSIITNDGKVGVGTLNPDEKLDVKGNINASGKIQENGNDLLPAGSIIMWSGEGDSVPAGWLLCNGENETPNLIDRFVMGGVAKKFDNADSTRVNGKNTMTLEEKHVPEHRHYFKMKAGPSPDDTSAEVTEWVLQPIKPEKNDRYHTRTYQTKGLTGRLDENKKKIETSSFDNRPEYYTLAFIMKL